MANNKALSRATAQLRKARSLKDRIGERLTRSGRLFLLGLIIACTIEVIADWNALLHDIDALRGELRGRAINYASIVSKAAIEPLLGYDTDGLDTLTAGLFDDQEVVMVRFADHQGTTVYDRLRPEYGDAFAERHARPFREQYAHQMQRDVTGILFDPEGLAARMANSRHRDFVQRWTDLISYLTALVIRPKPPALQAQRGVSLYQDRLKAEDGSHDSTLTYVLSTVVDERGEPWGVTVIAFGLEKQNAIIRKKLLKGGGMLLFLVGLVLVNNVNGRRDRLRLLDAAARIAGAKAAIAGAAPGVIEQGGRVVAASSLDQAEGVIDGLLWDGHTDGDRLEVLVVDPVGEGHAVASTALHVVNTYRARRDRMDAASIEEEIAELGRAAGVIPLGRPVALLLLRVDRRTGEFEAISGPLGAVRVAASGAVVGAATTPVASIPEHVVGPLTRQTGCAPPGGRLLVVCSGISEDGQSVDVERVAEFVARLRDGERQTLAQLASDAVVWARGKSPKLTGCDLLACVLDPGGAPAAVAPVS